LFLFLSHPYLSAGRGANPPCVIAEQIFTVIIRSDNHKAGKLEFGVGLNKNNMLIAFRNSKL